MYPAYFLSTFSVPQSLSLIRFLFSKGWPIARFRKLGVKKLSLILSRINIRVKYSKCVSIGKIIDFDRSSMRGRLIVYDA